jgi:hypothetical protein
MWHSHSASFAAETTINRYEEHTKRIIFDIGTPGHKCRENLKGGRFPEPLKISHLRFAESTKQRQTLQQLRLQRGTHLLHCIKIYRINTGNQK